MTEKHDASSGTHPYDGYVLDAENAVEIARLMLQDHILTQALGGPLSEQSDLSGVQQILDIGCGPGGWLLDVIQQYPHIHGTGIDVSHLMVEYATSQVAAQGLTNVQFHVMDATGPLDFPDNTFDLVNGRILMGFLSKAQWPLLLAECARIIKPGGILRITEAEWGFTNSPAYDKLTGIANLAAFRSGHSFSPNGRNIGAASMLRSLIQKAGYEVMGNKAHAVDYSSGTEAHDSNVQNMLIFYRLFRPFLVQMQVATNEEIEQLYAQMEQEMQAEDFCAIDYFLTVWGRKR